MSGFKRPMVKVRFSDGVTDYPAEYDDQDRIRPFDYRPSPVRKLVPVYNVSYDFIELLDGGFIAVPRMRETP